MTKRVIFEKDWGSFFDAYDLRTFDDFFEYAGSEVSIQSSKRNVFVMKLDDKGEIRTFYRKNFIKPFWRDMLSAGLQHGIACSQAEREFRNANILLANGIETYHPVCFGVHSSCGIEQRSFFINEEVRGRTLTEYLAASWHTMNTDARQDFVRRLGHFFQKIHAAGIRLPDSYIWHVYLMDPDQNRTVSEFGIIDLHRMQVRTHSRNRAAKDMGAFLFSLPDGFMDDALRPLFMDSYLDNGLFRCPSAFQNQVGHWQEKIAGRRKREVEKI